MTLKIKTRRADLNVTGESFMELHKVFKNQYKQLIEFIFREKYPIMNQGKI